MTPHCAKVGRSLFLPTAGSQDFHRVLHGLVRLSFTPADIFNRFPEFAESLLKITAGQVDSSSHWVHVALEEFARTSVLMRDEGVCQCCGINTVHLQQALGWYATHARPGQASVSSLKFALGHLAAQWPRRLWEADHVIPRSQGGALYALANLRTLCLQCHRGETDRLFFGKLAKFGQSKDMDARRVPKSAGAYQQKLALQEWLKKKA